MTIPHKGMPLELKERRKTMRRRKRNRRMEIDVRDVYVTNNITNNIVNVTNISASTRYQEYRHAHKHGKKRRKERPPKLFRYSASCGLLDQNVVSKMSNEELLLGSAENMGYAARGFCSSVGRAADGVCEMGDGLLKIIFAIADALFGR